MTATLAMTGMPMAPPRSVKAVTALSSPGVRWATIQSSTGWSRPARPSRSVTFS